MAFLCKNSVCIALLPFILCSSVKMALLIFFYEKHLLLNFFTCSVSAPAAPPPTRKFISVLQPHFKYLSDEMDPDSGLVSTLFSIGVINQREMEKIKAQQTVYERNELLLRFLLQSKTDQDFKKFVDALRIDQRHLADLLQLPTCSKR